MFWEVSNYNLWPMEKINFYILSFLLFLTSFSNSQDYEYDDYNYNENYDYTDDYSQELNDYLYDLKLWKFHILFDLFLLSLLFTYLVVAKKKLNSKYFYVF